MYKFMQEVNKKHNLHLKVPIPLLPRGYFLTILLDFLGPLPILHNPSRPVLGPSIPISQPNI
jgi:hypothetical protein